MMDAEMIPQQAPQAHGSLRLIREAADGSGASLVSAPVVFADQGDGWRAHVYPYRASEPLDPQALAEHVARREDGVRPEGDEWLRLWQETPDEYLDGILEAGFPAHRATPEEIERQARVWAELRLEYDERIRRGDVDW